MKKILSILIAGLIVLCSGCAQAPESDETMQNSEKTRVKEKASLETSNTEEKTAEKEEDEKNEENKQLVMSYALATEYLYGEKSFLDFDSGETATVTSLPEVNNRYAGTAGRYTITDLDKDGSLELLVEYNLNGDTAILRVSENQCIAYYVPYRGIIGLKTDGTVSFSNGASNGGVQTLYFDETSGVCSKEIIVYDTEKNYFEVNGTEVSEEYCNEAFEEQCGKADVIWHEI